MRADDDERAALTDAELEEWDRFAREGLHDRDRNLGTVARDRKIRRLVEELRKERRRHRPSDAT